ncbi:MAG: hypothetical protein M1299_01700 [Firmicutes bacterium]|nr:hypothetical protein [Bacillota bacterium]MCL5038540.1 hypothetical protein [Bacillota bacterium]
MFSTEVVLQRETVIRKKRRLPLPGEVLVVRGQKVTPDTILAKTEYLPGDPYIIDLQREFKAKLTFEELEKALVKKVGERVEAQEVIARHTSGFWGEVFTVKSPVTGYIEFISLVQGRVLIREDGRLAKPSVIVNVARDLDIWPRLLGVYMQYREGDEVKQGAILAASPGIAGMDYSFAPIGGRIERICTRTGTVTIVREARPTLVDAYIPGEVAEVLPGQGAVVQTPAAYLQGVFGLGGEAYGPLRLLVDSPAGELLPDGLREENRGEILVAGGYVGLAAMQKAMQLGVRGIITGGVDAIDLVQLLGKEIAVGITGHEDLAMTIVITEGFGPLPMNQRAFDLLREHQDHLVSINGQTQIRAGVIRPEVIMPLSTEVGG